MEEWQTRITRDPHFRKLKRALWQKWKRLAKDKHFLFETAALKLKLAIAYENHPEQIRSFFKPTFTPTLGRARNINQQMRRISTVSLRTDLKRYVRYVFRFGVVMELAQRRPYFRTRGVTPDPATKFHVKVVQGNLLPAHYARWDEDTPVADFFGDEELQVGPRMQALIDAGRAKYIQIDDHQQLSLLKQLVDIDFSSDLITFISLNGERRCLMCLIGEDISVDKTWRDAGKVVSEFQRRQYDRVKAGRPPNWKELRRRINTMLRTNLSLMELAVLLAKGNRSEDVYSMLSSLSQLKTKLK
jgi:hypothetical protein